MNCRDADVPGGSNWIGFLGTVLLASWIVLAKTPGAPAQTPRGLWPDTPDQAKVLAASFLGGTGTEWLVGGGIQADGAIVLVGNVAGGTFDLPAVKCATIGTERPAPPDYKPVPITGPNGGQKLSKSGVPLWEKPAWHRPGVTGFVVHLTADMKKVVAVHRLPWGSASIAAAVVDSDGAVYIAGRATNEIAALGADVVELPAVAAEARKDAPKLFCSHIFLARLSADGARADWVRHRKGPTAAPKLTVNPEGVVRVSSGRDVLAFDRAGKLVSTLALPAPYGPTVSVSPKDLAIVVGGEHNSATGREPWRCPTLNVYEPTGKLKYQLYDWGGPYVGMDGLRLVSDSAVRLVNHTRDGGLLISAWSDGGNSVMNNQPNDVRTAIPARGLGITAAGAGVLSMAYLVKIDPANWRGTAKTLWGPTLKGIDSAWIDTMADAGDGSVCIAGRSAPGLRQTSNRLAPEAEPAGHYVAILNPALDGVRFCSVLPGTDIVEVTDGSTNRGSGWGIVTGEVNGKVRVLFVGGAVQEQEVHGKTSATPTRDALQAKFGGGHADGYAVLLELAPTPAPAPPSSAAVPTARPTRASFEVGAAGDVNMNRPPVGTTFQFSPEIPPWTTVDIEFRDRAGLLWPSLLTGRPVDGTFTYAGEKSTGQFTVACAAATQARGDQARRVLGQLVPGPEAKADLKFTLDALGEHKQVDLKYLNKGKEAVAARPYWEAKATLLVAGKTFAVLPRVTYSFTENSPVGKKGSVAPTVKLTAWFTLTGKDLGLDSARAADAFEVRVFARGVASK